MSHPTLEPHTHRLDNGLKVLLDPVPREPFVAWRVVVRAGAAFDPPGRSGVAHLLEHMLANKGTTRLGTRDWTREAPLLSAIRTASVECAHAQGASRAAHAARLDALELQAWSLALPGELKKAASLLGIRGLNASTSQDRTWYQAKVPAHRLRQWAVLDAERFRAPVVRTFATELSTVCEEKRRSDDSPARATYGALQAALWGSHPYGRPILGHASELERLDVAVLEGFLSSWYQPSNLTICLSGAFEPGEALDLLDETFGRLSPGPTPSAGLLTPPAPVSQRVGLAHEDEDELRIAWRTVARDHPDRPALHLLDELLGNNATGLLARRLVHTRNARSARSTRSSLRFGGSLTLVGRPTEGGSLEELEQAFVDAIEAARAGDFAEADLSVIQRNAGLATERALESIDQRVTWLAQTATHGEAWPEAGRYPARLAAVTLDEVVSVAERYLTETRVTLLRTRGEPVPTLIAPPAVSERPPPPPETSAFVSDVLDRQPTLPDVECLVLGGDLHEVETPWGRLLHAENPCNRLFQATFVWNTGTNDRRGLGAAFGTWALAGVGDLDLSGLETHLATLGVGLSWQIRQRRSALTLTGPDEAWGDALALCTARLRSPVLEADKLTKHLRDRVQRRQERKKTRDTRVSALNQLALFGDDSSYRSRSLSDAEIGSLQQRPLADWTRPLLDERMTVLFSGTVAEKQVCAAVERSFQANRTPGPLRATRYQRATADEVWLVHHPAAQATITVLQPLPPAQKEQAAPRAVLAQLWGGLGGTFFRAVREQRGWAYSVSGQVSVGAWADDDSLRAATAATDPERAGATAALLVDLLRNTPLATDEVERARKATLEATASHRVRFRALPATWLSWEQKGYGADPRPARLSALKTLAPEAVSAYRAAHASSPVRVCIVGDLSRLDRAPLSALGSVVEWDPSSLFCF